MRKSGNAAGGNIVFGGIVSTAGAKIFGVEAARCGLTEKRAEAIFGDTVSAVSYSSTKAHYYPGSGKIKTKIIFSRTSGEILGAQIIGAPGAAKRIDVFAVAVQKKMRIEELASSDLVYAPPFSPVWDPILRTVNKALLKKNRKIKKPPLN